MFVFYFYFTLEEIKSGHFNEQVLCVVVLHVVDVGQRGPLALAVRLAVRHQLAHERRLVQTLTRALVNGDARAFAQHQRRSFLHLVDVKVRVLAEQCELLEERR